MSIQKTKDLRDSNSTTTTTKIKCIKEKCKFYYDSDDKYFETCSLISKFALLDKCHGISEIPNKKEELTCKIASLVKEYDYLNGLEKLIKNNQQEY